jgi:hypothetical protein
VLEPARTKVRSHARRLVHDLSPGVVDDASAADRLRQVDAVRLPRRVLERAV